jgi:hypothetical protein
VDAAPGLVGRPAHRSHAFASVIDRIEIGMPAPLQRSVSRGARRALTVLAGAMLLAPLSGLAAPVRVVVDGYACHSGRYALILPQHAPSLRNIGRHRVVELGSETRDGVSWARRRLEYNGLALEILERADQPARYVLVALEATSRRWHLGALSVAATPWRGAPDPALQGVALEGEIQLAGPRDTATVRLSGGRVQRLSVRCAA